MLKVCSELSTVSSFKFEKASHTHKIHVESLGSLFLAALAPLPIPIAEQASGAPCSAIAKRFFLLVLHLFGSLGTMLLASVQALAAPPCGRGGQV